VSLRFFILNEWRRQSLRHLVLPEESSMEEVGESLLIKNALRGFFLNLC